MRDEHRIKDKLAFSLDHSQVVSAIIGGIVVLGAVFFLGVLVGRKLVVNPAAPAGPDLLSAVDHKTAVLDEVRKDPPLTFQEELTKKGDPVKALAVAEKKQTAGLINGAPSPNAPTVSPSGVEGGVSDRAAETVKKTTMAPAAPPEPEDKPSVASADRSQANASMHPAAESNSAGGVFTLQLAATQDREDANRRVARLRERGYAPYVVSVQLPGKGTWYRVRMGNFSSREAAQHYLADFHRETQMDAFVTSSR